MRGRWCTLRLERAGVAQTSSPPPVQVFARLPLLHPAMALLPRGCSCEMLTVFATENGYASDDCSYLAYVLARTTACQWRGHVLRAIALRTLPRRPPRFAGRCPARSRGDSRTSEPAWSRFLSEFREWCESEEAKKLHERLPAIHEDNLVSCWTLWCRPCLPRCSEV